MMQSLAAGAMIFAICLESLITVLPHDCRGAESSTCYSWASCGVLSLFCYLFIQNESVEFIWQIDWHNSDHKLDSIIELTQLSMLCIAVV